MQLKFSFTFTKEDDKKLVYTFRLKKKTFIQQEHIK